jgi:WD40 repeat protein
MEQPLAIDKVPHRKPPRKAVVLAALVLPAVGWIAWEPDIAPALRREAIHGDSKDGYIFTLAFAPDGRSIACGGERLILRDLGGQPARQLRAGTDPAARRDGDDGMLTLVAAFSPDGTRLASGDHDGTVRLWDVATGRELAAWREHRDRRVLALAFSRDGATLASAADDRVVRLWDLTRLVQRQALDWPPLDVVVLLMPRPSSYALAFGVDGQTLAAAEFRSRMTLCTWDLSSTEGRLVLTDVPNVWPVRFSPDARSLLAADPSSLALIDVATGENRVDLAPPRVGAWGGLGSAFSPDGRHLAVPWVGSSPPWLARRLGFDPRFLAHFGLRPGLRKDVMIHDGATGAIRAALRGETIAAFAPDGRTLATTDGRGRITLWDTAALP